MILVALLWFCESTKEKYGNPSLFRLLYPVPLLYLYSSTFLSFKSRSEVKSALCNNQWECHCTAGVQLWPS